MENNINLWIISIIISLHLKQFQSLRKKRRRRNILKFVKLPISYFELLFGILDTNVGAHIWDVQDTIFFYFFLKLMFRGQREGAFWSFVFEFAFKLTFQMNVRIFHYLGLSICLSPFSHNRRILIRNQLSFESFPRLSTSLLL